MRNTFILICAAILLFAFSSPIMADNVKMKDNPKCKQWHSVIGKWSNETEMRVSPTGTWEKTPGTEEVSWILNGAFLESRPKGIGGEELEIIGYDPILKTHFSSGFDGRGGWWHLTSGGWSGTTWSGNGEWVTPEKKLIHWRCDAEYNSDFTSRTVTCDGFADGQWWVCIKGKGTKVK